VVGLYFVPGSQCKISFVFLCLFLESASVYPNYTKIHFLSTLSSRDLLGISVLLYF
jgi:hypothetical protein